MGAPSGVGAALGAETSAPARLLAASVLSFCFLLTGAQTGTMPITVDPAKPIEGQSVSLTPAAIPANSVTCRWHRGADVSTLILIYYLPPKSAQTLGPGYTGRESMKADCSLHISNLNVTDSGKYGVTIDGPGVFETGEVDIEVSEILSKPTVSISSTLFPRELLDPLHLTCDTSSTLANVSWFLNGRPVENSSRIQLSGRNRSLAIQQVLRGDAGNYQCQVFNLAFNERSDALFVPVVYGPDTPIITPNTSVYYEHSDIDLTCVADAFPSPKYTWLINGRDYVNGSNLVIHDVSREQNGNYTCKAISELTHNTASTTLEIWVVGGIYNIAIHGPSSAIEHGHPVTLECVSQGTNVSYYWLKGDQVVKAGGHIFLENNNQNLTLNPATRDDAGSYTCFGNNSISFSYSDPHQLEIFYGPDEAIIEPSKQVYLENSVLNLSCSANSNPPANYSWYHNGDPLPHENNSRLVISPLRLTDAGTYACRASNNMTGLISTSSLEISVLEPVSHVTITSNTSKALENHIIVLTCNSVGTDVSYSWLKGNQSLEVGERISLSDSNRVVTFNPTLRDDSDVYTCHVNNSFSSGEGNYTLNVLYGPDDPVISPDTSCYKVGSQLNLSCNADSNPPANYTWFYNNHTSEGNTLFLFNLTPNETGNYTCQASNDETGSSRSQVLEIRVLEPVSHVTITSNTSKALENHTIVLTCNSVGTDVSYSWLKGNQSLEVGERISLSDNNRVLTFNPTLRDDSDVYTCYVNNSISSNNSTYTLNVLYGPDVPVISPDTSYYEVGSHLNLSCNADSNPPANYIWFFNNQTREGNTLFLSNLSFNNTGSYTCQASNDETGSNRSQVLQIWVQEILSRPILSPAEYMPLEKETVTLECDTSNSSTVIVSWYKDGGPVPANAVPSGNNRTLTIHGFTKADDGNYTCVARNAVSNGTSNPSVLTMAYGPNDVKINRSEDITVGLGSKLVLLCSADSNPAAQFQWFLNKSDTHVTKETYSVDSVTWKDGGNYTCQAHNTMTKLTASASITVRVSTEAPGGGGGGSGLSGGAIAGIVIGCLAAVILIGGLLYYLCTKTSLGRTERHAANGNIPSAPGHNQGVTDTKPRTGEEDIQYSTLAFNANNPPQPAPGATQPLDSNIIYSEIKKK